MHTTRLPLLVLTSLGLVTAPVSAKHDPPPEAITKGWTATVSSTATYTDNLFEEGPRDSPRSDVYTTLRAEARRDVRESPWWLPPIIGFVVGGEIYARTHQADNVFYEVDLRERFRWGRSGVYYRGTPRRLSFIDETQEAGAPPVERDVLYGENIFGSQIDRTFLASRRLRAGIGYEAQLRNFRPPDDDRDYTGHYPNVEARYEIVPWLIPRGEVGYDIQDARSVNRTRRGVRTIAGFDGTWRRASWGFRWYLTRWNYNAALPGDSNFERHDDRNAFLFTGAVRVWRALSVTTRYRFLNSQSTRSDRDFSKNEIGGGFAYAF